MINMSMTRTANQPIYVAEAGAGHVVRVFFARLGVLISVAAGFSMLAFCVWLTSFLAARLSTLGGALTIAGVSWLALLSILALLVGWQRQILTSQIKVAAGVMVAVAAVLIATGVLNVRPAPEQDENSVATQAEKAPFSLATEPAAHTETTINMINDDAIRLMNQSIAVRHVSADPIDYRELLRIQPVINEASLGLDELKRILDDESLSDEEKIRQLKGNVQILVAIEAAKLITSHIDFSSLLNAYDDHLRSLNTQKREDQRANAPGEEKDGSTPK